MTTPQMGPPGIQIPVSAPAVRRALQRVNDKLNTVVTGTVVSNYAVLAKTLVRLDNDPDERPVRAWALTQKYPLGARVVMLRYPPRGLVVLGNLDSSSMAIDMLRILGTADVSVTSTDHPFQIGPDSGQNIAIDNNEIMARENGAAGILNLQNNGGVVQVGGSIQSSTMRHDDDDAAANVVVAVVGPVADNTNGPNFSFSIPSSGVVTIFWSADTTNSGAGFSTMTIRVHQNDAAGAVLFTGGSAETARKEGSSGRATIATFTTVTGLPPSSTGFVEGWYSSTSGTATFRNAKIVVIPSP